MKKAPILGISGTDRIDTAATYSPLMTPKAHSAARQSKLQSDMLQPHYRPVLHREQRQHSQVVQMPLLDVDSTLHTHQLARERPTRLLPIRIAKAFSRHFSSIRQLRPFIWLLRAYQSDFDRWLPRTYQDDLEAGRQRRDSLFR
jgi:hypothetical protein